VIHLITIVDYKHMKHRILILALLLLLIDAKGKHAQTYIYD
jgi:hypothetical protein